MNKCTRCDSPAHPGDDMCVAHMNGRIEEARVMNAKLQRLIGEQPSVKAATPLRQGMRLVISAGNSKREINGPYNICASRADLMRLAKAIESTLSRTEPQLSFEYGWVFVVDKHENNLINTPPTPWDAS